MFDLLLVIFFNIDIDLVFVLYVMIINEFQVVFLVIEIFVVVVFFRGFGIVEKVGVVFGVVVGLMLILGVLFVICIFCY